MLWESTKKVILNTVVRQHVVNYQIYFLVYIKKNYKIYKVLTFS